MRPQGPERLTIELLEDRGDLVTRWSGLFEKRKPIRTCIRVGEIADLKRRFARDLQQVKDSLGKKLEPSWTHLNTAVHRLLEIGDQLSFDFFGPDRKKVDNLWRKHCLGWHQENMPIPIVTIWGYANMFLPFEFLRCFYDPRLPTLTNNYPRINSLETLNDALKQLLGFACIVKRIHGAAGTPRPSTDAEGRDVLYTGAQLPMRLFLNRSLKGVRTEERQLQKLNRLDIAKWPLAGKRATAEELAEQLWSAERIPALKKKRFQIKCITSPVITMQGRRII